jgi:hypothetical protein
MSLATVGSSNKNEFMGMPMVMDTCGVNVALADAEIAQSYRTNPLQDTRTHCITGLPVPSFQQLHVPVSMPPHNLKVQHVTCYDRLDERSRLVSLEPPRRCTLTWCNGRKVESK